MVLDRPVMQGEELRLTALPLRSKKDTPAVDSGQAGENNRECFTLYHMLEVSAGCFNKEYQRCIFVISRRIGSCS
ncbi:hypothetical protein SAMN06265218_109187 [Fodinibius sediminis]|uniref:Uncharacterized protein n=1 Tax=Fodinibius sediminis TaxID=1214077 RepID=A0A521DCM9_9BACT|nr:hypothetical protein SAMN06265218_109187 [Fodinibius sediminis]